ncbi:MAG: PAS domain S-box protein [Acidobacteriota bacterium]
MLEGQTKTKLFLHADASQNDYKLSQDMFSKAFQFNPMPMTISSLSSGILLSVNESWLELFGFERRQVIGKPSNDLGCWHDPEEKQKMFDMLFESGSVKDYDLNIVTSTGQVRYGSMFMELVEIDDEKCLISAFHDLTDRKKIEEELEKHKSLLEEVASRRTAQLQETNRKMQRILENIEDAYVMLDNDLRIIFANTKAESLLDKSGAEMLGKGILDCYPEMSQSTLDLLLSVVNTKIPKHFEVHSANLNKWIEFSIYPSVGTISVIIKDITLRKNGEEALRQSEERFSAAFHSSPIIMSITLLDSGVIIDVNEAWLHASEYRRDEVVGRTYKQIEMLEEDARQEMIRRIIEDGRFKEMEMNFRTKKGDVRTGLVSAEIIVSNNEYCVLATIVDITERKRLENDMARLDRLNLIGEMAASIGHEVRNPMTTVRGFIQMVSDKEGCQPYREYFDLMIEELDRANSIITNFLSMANNKAVELEPLSLNTIIKSMYPLIYSDALLTDKSVKLDLGRIPKAILDEKEIRQMILNLARNGLDAMDAGGLLTIGTYSDKNEVILFVRDEGGGIDPELQLKIGTPFITTKKDGTGLGLAVCYSIANRHGASIRFNTGDTGTTFQVRFKKRALKSVEDELISATI